MWRWNARLVALSVLLALAGGGLSWITRTSAYGQSGRYDNYNDDNVQVSGRGIFIYGRLGSLNRDFTAGGPGGGGK